MNLKRNIVSIVLVGIAISIALWVKFTMPKIAYVNSYKLLEEYEGMKEMQFMFKGKLDAMNRNADSLQRVIQSGYELYRQDSVKLSDAVKKELGQMIQFNTLKYNELQNTIESFTTNEVQSFSDGLIQQINDYIKKYGDEKGYDVILGTDESGNIVYGSESCDITNEILTGLNKSYLGNE